jgi:transcriptional regulator with XRE-family HTH domain
MRISVPTWTIGDRLKKARQVAGVSTIEMAAELGVTHSTVSRIERDEGGPPKQSYLTVWALRCGVSRHWLATGAEPDGDGRGPEPGSPLVGASTMWYSPSAA